MRKESLSFTLAIPLGKPVTTVSSSLNPSVIPWWKPRLTTNLYILIFELSELYMFKTYPLWIIPGLGSHLLRNRSQEQEPVDKDHFRFDILFQY